MNERPVKNKVTKKTNRVNIDESNWIKLGNLIEDAHKKQKGIRLSPKEVLNWIIESRVETFSPKEMKKLKDRFFDEECLLNELIKEVKKAKSEGKKITLGSLVMRKSLPKKSIKRDLKKSSQKDSKKQEEDSSEDSRL